MHLLTNGGESFPFIGKGGEGVRSDRESLAVPPVSGIRGRAAYPAHREGEWKPRAIPQPNRLAPFPQGKGEHNRETAGLFPRMKGLNRALN